jgi:hypothetical protein
VNEGVPIHTSRLLERYNFNNIGSALGFGLSRLGCDTWNRANYGLWSNPKSVVNKQLSSHTHPFTLEQISLSLIAAVYTNNYGKSIGKDAQGRHRIVRQYLPDNSFAGLGLSGYGTLMVICNGNVQDSQSVGAGGTRVSRTRSLDANGNVINATENSFGANRFHLLPEFDHTRRICAITDAWCRSYGLEYRLCKEGEDEDGCVNDFSESNCTDYNRYPDCILTSEQRTAEMFFGKNVVRRIFKPIGSIMSGRGDYLCYDDNQDIESCPVLGVDPINLSPKCWNTSRTGCSFKSCSAHGESF